MDCLIVGLSITGLTLAKELDNSNVSFMGVERHETIFKASKATGIHPWTMEGIEHWKLNEIINSSGTKLLGKKIMHSEKIINEDKFYDKDISIPQYKLEEIILNSVLKVCIHNFKPSFNIRT